MRATESPLTQGESCFFSLRRVFLLLVQSTPLPAAMGDEFLNMDYTDNNETGDAQPATATLAPAENGIGGPPRAAEADGNGEATDMDRARMLNGQEASPQEKEKVARPSHDFRKCEVGGRFVTVVCRGARVSKPDFRSCLLTKVSIVYTACQPAEIYRAPWVDGQAGLLHGRVSLPGLAVSDEDSRSSSTYKFDGHAWR